MIACLGWGSLCYRPGNLPIKGQWQQDGPSIPVEFARISKDGRITLTIVEGAAPITVLWVPLDVTFLHEAVEELFLREGAEFRSSIGRVPGARPTHLFSDVIQNWAISRGIEAVVWTALKPGMSTNDRGRVPSLVELSNHIESLSAEARADALDYVARAPAQIKTAYRIPLQTVLETAIS
jgi:hypothetical protein